MFSFYLFNFSVQLGIANSTFILNSSYPWFYSLSVDVWFPKSYLHFADHLNTICDNLTANSLRWIHHVLFCNKSTVFFASHKQVQKTIFHFIYAGKSFTCIILGTNLFISHCSLLKTRYIILFKLDQNYF